jgi:hypothetical protein
VTDDDDQIILRVAEALERAALAHQASDFQKLKLILDEVERKLTGYDGPHANSIGISMRFFDGWVKDSSHNWNNYDGIRREDWPKYARHIVAALQYRKIIESPVIMKYFDKDRSIQKSSLLVTIMKFLRV